MPKGFVGALTMLLAGAGLALGQPMPPATPTDGAPARQAGAPTSQPPATIGGSAMTYPVVPTFSAPPGPADLHNGACGNGGACGADGCDGSKEYFWVGAEYLLWWVRKAPVNIPLVTTSSPQFLGVLGQGDTAVLFGGQELDYNSFSGARFTLGAWGSKTHDWGVEGSGFFLENRTMSTAFNSSITGTPLIARPFVNPINNTETSVLVAAPGQFGGTVVIGSSSELYGMEANLLRSSLYSDSSMRVELLAGFRYVHLEENLSVDQDTSLLAGGSSGFVGQIIFPPARVQLNDTFSTLNDFYGGQLGARVDFGSGNFTFNARLKVAFGTSHEVLRISGVSRLSNTPAGQPQGAFPGGLLALSSNSGRQSESTFAVVPEFGFNVGYQLSDCLRVFAGYTFLYWSDVARPGDQLNRTVNPTLIPTSQAFGVAAGPSAPTTILQKTDFWAQGLNFGVELRY